MTWFRTGRERRPYRKYRPQFEVLEDRIVTAGNVLVRQLGPDLGIIGDLEGNEIEIEFRTRDISGTVVAEIRVVGMGTTVNGQPEVAITAPLAAPFFRDMYITMDPGPNTPCRPRPRGDLRPPNPRCQGDIVRISQTDLRFYLEDDLLIDTGSGEARVEVEYGTVAGKTEIRTGPGDQNDVILLDNLRTSELVVQTGGGLDTVHLNSNFIKLLEASDPDQNRHSLINTGSGNDTLTAIGGAYGGELERLGSEEDVPYIGDVEIDMGSGADEASLRLSFFKSPLQLNGGEGEDRVELCATHILRDATLSLAKGTDSVRMGSNYIGEEGNTAYFDVKAGSDGGSLELLDDNFVWVLDERDPTHSRSRNIKTPNRADWEAQFRPARNVSLLDVPQHCTAALFPDIEDFQLDSDSTQPGYDSSDPLVFEHTIEGPFALARYSSCGEPANPDYALGLFLGATDNITILKSAVSLSLWATNYSSTPAEVIVVSGSSPDTRTLSIPIPANSFCQYVEVTQAADIDPNPDVYLPLGTIERVRLKAAVGETIFDDIRINL